MHDVLLFESVSSMCLMRFFVVVDRWCSRIRLKTRVLSEIGTFGHTMIRLYFRLSLCYPPLLVCAASSVGRRIVIMVVCDWLRSVQSIKSERAQTVFSLLLLAAGNFCCCWPIDLSSLRVASSIFWTYRFVRNRGLPGFTPLLLRRTMGWPIATITMNIYK